MLQIWAAVSMVKFKKEDGKTKGGQFFWQHFFYHNKLLHQHCYISWQGTLVA